MILVEFFRKHTIIKHFLFATAFILVLIWIISFLLNIFTDHNKTIKVPDLTGVFVKDLPKFIEEKNIDVKYTIVDSVFDSKRKGTVVDQDPKPNTDVKAGRKIYLSIASILVEKVKMPNLIDLSLRQAISLLETYKLKVGRLDYVPDIAKNAVLRQKHKGKEIKPGTSIDAGSTIHLILGSGLKNEKTTAPDIIGKRRDAAILEVNNASLNIGAETFDDDADTTTARVFRQQPTKGAKLNIGSSVDVWYKSEKNYKKHLESNSKNE